jgi:transposase InsO family protein
LFFKKLLTGAYDGIALANPHVPSLIIISTKINNKKISAMVDTGATSSLIKMSTIIKLNYQNQVYKQRGEIILGDAKTKMTQYGWIYLNVKIKNLNCGIRAMVVDNLTTDFIVGMDFIQKFKIEIKTSQQCLVIHHRQQQTYVKFEKPNAVRLTQQHVIFPRCKCIVNAMVTDVDNGDYMFLKAIDEKTQQYKRIRFSDGIIDVKNNTVQLTIYNPSTKVVTLPRSMLLGTVDHLTPDVYCSTLFSDGNIQECDYVEHKKTNATSMNTIMETLSQHFKGNESKHQQLLSLLQEHRMLFDISEPRRIRTTIHHVINTGDHAPVNAKPYFKTIEQRKNIQQEIDKMLTCGIVVPSHSPWSSPVVLLTKPNGEFRFIVDYRRLNSITTKDSYPQPTVEELLQRLGGHSWFTKLDLKSGYYQIPIQQEDKEKTAFITQDGLYQFEVLPMGLMNAPPSFQRVMNNILGYKRWDYILVYLDDILIFSDSFEAHMKHLQEIFNVLSAHHFTLNPDKCSVAQQSIDFLSHTITKESIIPSKDRIQAILDMSQPTTLAQANRFIGKIGWYRKFISNFAQIAAPIHRVTNKIKRKRREFYWHDDQIQAANKLKQILTEEPLLLKYPHPTSTFILATDASEYAIGGTLKQIIGDKTHYNYFLSRLLTTTERNYPTIDREALAIFWCMEKLQQYLGGRDVIVYTDHKPLEHFHKKSKFNSKRIVEWLIKHQDIIPQITEVTYRKGCNHGDADGMSRPEIDNQYSLNVITRSMTKSVVPQVSCTNDNELISTAGDHNQVENPMTFDFSLTRISTEQERDQEIMYIKQQMAGNDTSDSNYVIENDVVYKLIKHPHTVHETKVIFIPLSMREEVIRSYHDHPTAGHFGLNRTWLKLRKTCYWPGMKRSIHNYIRSCEKCAKFNIRRTKAPGHLCPIEYPEGPLELLGMDFWGPTPHYSSNGNKYVLVITDYYTKYVVAHALPDNTAITTAKCFVEQFIFKYGVPKRLITDQGVHFNNELMKNVTMLLGTHHIKSTAYHPQTNGLVERFNGTFHPQLAKLYNEDLNDWDEYLPPVIYAYNTGEQSGTGYSPFQLMFGRNPILPMDHTPAIIKFLRPNDYWRQLMKCMNVYREAARQHIQLHQQQSKQRFDRNRKDPRCELNDLVLWKVPGHRGKFEERFSGPYIVISKQHPSYTIQDPHSSTIKQVHINDLKPVYQRHIGSMSI